MSFSSKSRMREMSYMTQILSVFGTVEAKQMRILFSHMSDENYGKLMTRMAKEGVIYYEPDGRYISSSRYALSKAEIPKSIRAFWLFIMIKDKVNDFVNGREPTLVSLSTTKAEEYDLIPLDQQNMDLVIESARVIPKKVYRLLIVSDTKEAEGMEYRSDRDYIVQVSEDGTINMYRMGGE